ncbi:MAG: ATP-binding protein [Clostridia bacterium]|nr:ATP-binding protein [Clostridia bacterium]
MKFIPRKSKVKTEVYRGVSILDVILMILGVISTILIFISNLPYKWYIGLSFASFWCMLFVPVSDGIKLYYSIVLMFKFLAYKKEYFKDPKNKNDDIRRIIPFMGVSTDKFISFGEYYGMVIQVHPMEFGMMDNEKQEMTLNTFAQAFSRLGKNQKLSIVKVKKPLVLDELVNFEDAKYNTLMDMADRGLYGSAELEARSPVFEERLRAINLLNNDNKVLMNFYYMVIYDTDRELLESTVNGIVATLLSSQTPIATDIVTGDELLVFLKSTFDDNFDQRELAIMNAEEKIKWATPNKVKFKINTTNIDDRAYRTFTITDYPLEVANAWLFPIFQLDNCRVVVNITPVDKFKAEKTLDKSLMEMEIRMGKVFRESEKIEAQTHYDSLRELLASLKTNNENIYNTNIHITAEEGVKKEVRAVLKQYGFKYAENFGRQINAFVSANISRLDALSEYERGIHTSSLCACFPFISSELKDVNGFYLGYNQYPVFVNFFTRNNERVNSNMMIIGKSGGGKSFATKTLLTNFAADNTRVFILDPENEYEILCNNLNGKMIDVASSQLGIFNPFHIYPSLEAEEGAVDDTFNAHLQFLENFFKVILQGINTDAFETLNSIIVDLYREKNIGPETAIIKLKPEDFPIFDDLMKLVNSRLQTEKEPYVVRNLQTVKTYIEKFATGGRNSNLWNGPTSISTNENFICFNFRTLLANDNDLIANAQMLLVFKYLNNEIIKNRDFNLKYFNDPTLKEEEHRRVIVCVDEAHVFINKKFPVALNFLLQMAKRIRKYYGMQIIITQNIKDFVGSPEIAQQSTAIINACQYSLIFALSPNDMTDLLELYKNAGGINDEERDQIVTAKRGQAFMITSAMRRTSVQIEALPVVRTIFEQKQNRA